MTLDPGIVNLARAIRDLESGGNYEARGKSGEFGAYQFMPATWKAWAKEHLGNANAKPTRENQNQVAYKQLLKWKNQGYNPGQIASLWNSGNPDPRGKVGVNKQGVGYNVPQYVQKVYARYQYHKTGVLPVVQQAMAASEDPQPKQPSPGSFVQGVAQDIARPFLTLGLNVARAAKGIGALASRDPKKIAEASNSITKPQDFGYFGKVNVGGYDEQGKKLSTVDTIKSAVGAGGTIGLNIATPGLKTAGSLGLRALKTAGLGAGFGASSALEKGGGIKEVTQSAVTGGLLGGGLTVGGAALGGVGQALTQKLPQRLVQSAVGQSKGALMAGKDISEYVLKTRKMGTANQLIQGSQNAISRLSTNIQASLEAAPKTARILKSELISGVTKRVNSEGGAITSKEISKIINDLAPQSRGLLNRQSMSLTEANRLRQSLDKTLGDRGFLSSQLPFNKEVLRDFANTLRERVKVLAPAGTREAFAELAKEITLRDALLNRYSSQAGNQVVNAFDLLLAGGSFLGGGPAGAVGAVALKKGVQSVVGKTATAQVLNYTGERMTSLLKKLTPAERLIILNLISQLSSGREETSDSGFSSPSYSATN